MAHLVVLGLDNREDAERVFDLTGDLARQQLLQLPGRGLRLARRQGQGPHPAGHQPHRPWGGQRCPVGP